MSNFKVLVLITLENQEFKQSLTANYFPYR